MDDRLRPLWDFDDLDASEGRLRAQLEAETAEAGRAEVLTQLARVCGLRSDFSAGEALLDEAAGLAGANPIVATRVHLERGRLRRSDGDPVTARPLFVSAFALALEARHHFIAADAAHMVALAATDRDDFVEWTSRGIELAETHHAASYWVGPLLNNLGWEHYESGDFELALEAFEQARAARERDPDNMDGIELATYAVGKTLRALDRADEAVPLLEQTVESARCRAHEDGWYHEELAEAYAAAGRLDEAREQARLAIPLLERDDSGFPQRRERLDGLAAA